MKKLLLFLFSLLTGVALFIWVIRFVGWEEVKSAFLIFTGWQGLLILGLTALMVVFAIWRWKEILKSQRCDIPSVSLAGPYLGWVSLSYLAPVLFLGADIFRGYVLKEKFSIPWVKGIASIIVERILEWTIHLIVFFIGIVFLFSETGLLSKDIGLILAGAFIFFSVATGFFYFKGFKKESIVKFFINHFNNKKLLNGGPLEVEKEIFKSLDFREVFFWKVIVLTFLRVGAALLRVWLLIFFLGETIGLFPTLSVLGFSYFVLLIPVPAVIGTHEAVQVFTFGVLGLGMGAATAFTMIIRGADIILALTGVIILFKLGVGLLRKALLKKINNFANKNNVF